MKPGERFDFRNMRIEKISFYERLVHHEELRTIWRYAFRAPDGRRFVYSGKFLGTLAMGEVCAFRATVKQPLDKYGFIRLARLTLNNDCQEQML